MTNGAIDFYDHAILAAKNLAEFDDDSKEIETLFPHPVSFGYEPPCKYIGKSKKQKFKRQPVPTETKNALKERSHCSCEVCGFRPPLSILRSFGRKLLVIHHVVAVCRGGSNHIDNLLIVCPFCHAFADMISMTTWISRLDVHLERVRGLVRLANHDAEVMTLRFDEAVQCKLKEQARVIFDLKAQMTSYGLNWVDGRYHHGYEEGDGI